MKKINIIHQIFINDSKSIPKKISEFIEYNQKSIRFFLDSVPYKIWNVSDIRDMIFDNFSEEVLLSYDKLVPYAYKADLARYCILSLYGGLYVDLSIRFTDTISIPDEVELLAFRDREFGSPSWSACANGLIWSMPGRPEFTYAIETVLRHCRERFYGRNALYPTGPVVWGRSIVAVAASRAHLDGGHDQWVGAMQPLAWHAPGTHGFFTPDGRMIALRAKKVGADLTHMGARGVNNYGRIWSNRLVYGETSREWLHTDRALHISSRAVRRANGIAFVGGPGEVVTFGPYVAVEPGEWTFSLRFDREVATPLLALEVQCNTSQKIIKRVEFPASDVPVSCVSINFNITDRSDSIEFRSRIFGTFDGLITSMDLVPASTGKE